METQPFRSTSIWYLRDADRTVIVRTGDRAGFAPGDADVIRRTPVGARRALALSLYLLDTEKGDVTGRAALIVDRLAAKRPRLGVEPEWQVIYETRT